ncbi:MAG: hypothetical protein KKE23_00150 [Nanoarchaeota archaeon]|nr:hypothetical protein [Nanoarchaeota archaeon]
MEKEFINAKKSRMTSGTPKTSEEVFKRDEQTDIALLEEAMERSENYDEMAKWLSSVWQRKYGSEFRGNIVLSYDVAEETFTLRCGDKMLLFDEDELSSIPKQLTFLRRTK